MITNRLHESKEIFLKKISNAIQQKKETEQLDFKQEWYIDLERLLHDILCFANSLHNYDCYIFIGIDDNGSIVGVQGDKNRKNQAQILDYISKIHFAGDNVPPIAVETFEINLKEIDVITIYNSFKVPFFLKKRNKFIHKLQEEFIYVRKGDKNTAIDKNANYYDIEALWKKRFYLTMPPLEQIKNSLKNHIEWTKSENGYYNAFRPDFQITINYDSDRSSSIGEFYVFTQTNSNYYYGELNILFNQTILATFQIVSLDGGRYVTTTPDWEYIDIKEYRVDVPLYEFKCFLRDSLKYQLQEFLLDSSDTEEVIAKKRFDEVVLYFNNNSEKSEFRSYILTNPNVLEKLLKESEKHYFTIESSNKLHVTNCLKRLQTGLALKKALDIFREKNGI